MDDRDLRPRHHRAPPRSERFLDFALTVLAFSVGGLFFAGLVAFGAGVIADIFN